MDLNSEKDIENLIENKIQEDTNLDYKTPDFSKGDFSKELAKDVSAMANSDGGIILYGIQEEDHFPKEIIWIEKDGGYCERIEQIISSKIFRKIENVNVKKVLSDDKTKFVIVIEIPKSDTAPHQIHKDSKQRRYYKRHGSITEQMEHYEIEDLFFKRKKPVLEIHLNPLKSKNPAFEIDMQNAGKVIAEKVFLKILIPREFKIDGEGWVDMGEVLHPFGLYSVYQYFDNIMPVYPQHTTTIGRLYHPKQNLLIKELTLGFLLVSKDSELKVGKLVLNSNSEEEIKTSGGGFKTSTLKIDPTFKEKIEYSKDKEGIPVPGVSFYD